MSSISNAAQESLAVRQTTVQELSPIIESTGQAMISALRDGGKILVFGNGGSAAEAQHFVGELLGRYKAERRSLAAIALSTDTSVLTCIGNDYSYEDVFSRQINALTQSGDIALGLTTSGRSANVLKALKAAKENGAVTMALTGEVGLSNMDADYVLAMPSKTTARIQEEHLFIIHCWCDAIDEAFQEK
jgi:D-sedoheptulose 7-phosphate isomerase